MKEMFALASWPNQSSLLNIENWRMRTDVDVGFCLTSHLPWRTSRTDSTVMYASEDRVWVLVMKEIFWLHPPNKIYRTVRNCASWARNGKRLKRRRQLQLFLATTFLECFSKHTHSLISWIWNESMFGIVHGSVFNELEKCSSWKEWIRIRELCFFFMQLYPVGYLTFFSRLTALSFLSEFFVSTWRFVWVNYMSAASHHHHSSRQIERCNKINVTRVRFYDFEQ